uniref:Uncharacterized protein n=1 Tax=Meloidogyne incognita TaxID=6306 RepID=A0A914M8D5_MELIC
MFNSSTGMLQVYIFKNPDSGFLLQMLAYFSWLHVHGAPPVVYLLLNKTVGNDTKNLFKIIHNKISHSNGGMDSMLG